MLEWKQWDGASVSLVVSNLGKIFGVVCQDWWGVTGKLCSCQKRRLFSQTFFPSNHLSLDINTATAHFFSTMRYLYIIWHNHLWGDISWVHMSAWLVHVHLKCVSLLSTTKEWNITWTRWTFLYINKEQVDTPPPRKSNITTENPPWRCISYWKRGQFFRCDVSFRECCVTV